MSDNDSSPKNTSGLSDMAQRALDAILGRGKDDQDEDKGKDTSSSSVGRRESSGEGSAEDILSAGTQSAARSANRPEPNMGGGSHYDTSKTSGGGAASTSATGGSGSSSTDATDVYMGGGSHYDTSKTSGVVEEEEFVGSGGVGSPEFMEALRKGHEAAGGEYTSDLSNPNNPDDGPTGV